MFAIGLIVDPLNSFQRLSIRTHFKLDDAAIIYITVAGFLIINALFIICQLMGDRIPKRTVSRVNFRTLLRVLKMINLIIFVVTIGRIKDRPFFIA